jgi:hypothetical protein
MNEHCFFKVPTLRPIVLLILLLRKCLVQNICEVILGGERRSTLRTGAVCPALTTHGFAWDITRASGVRRRVITARKVVGVNYT